MASPAVKKALAGCRPVLEFQFSDFATLAMEQIVNQAAKLRYMLGGKVNVPLVMRFPAGSGTGAAAQPSQSLDAWLAQRVPLAAIVLSPLSLLPFVVSEQIEGRRANRNGFECWILLRQLKRPTGSRGEPRFPNVIPSVYAEFDDQNPD